MKKCFQTIYIRVKKKLGMVEILQNKVKGGKKPKSYKEVKADPTKKV